MEKNLRDAIDTFCHALVRNGVPEQDVKKSLSQIVGRLRRYSDAILDNLDLPMMSTDEVPENVESVQNRRSDFLGRAMLYRLEKYLPSNAEEMEQIRKTPITGKVPREAFQGIINAIKNSQGYLMVEEYEELCASKVNQFLRDDGEIEMDRFVNDPEIQQAVNEMLSGAKTAINNLEEEIQKQWVMNVVTNSPSFKELERQLTHEEYDILVKTLFVPMV